MSTFKCIVLNNKQHTRDNLLFIATFQRFYLGSPKDHNINININNYYYYDCYYKNDYTIRITQSNSTKCYYLLNYLFGFFAAQTLSLIYFGRIKLSQFFLNTINNY